MVSVHNLSSFIIKLFILGCTNHGIMQGNDILFQREVTIGLESFSVTSRIEYGDLIVHRTRIIGPTNMHNIRIHASSSTE